jgi:hypothetical protein
MNTFSLHPFESESDLKLSGSIDRTNNRLIAKYDLYDPLNQVFIPDAHSSSRQDNLWKATCFEFFLGLQNSPQYWEFNLSPTHNWNVYRFSHYRSEMQKEQAFTELPFEFDTTENEISLSIALDLSPIIQSDQFLNVGITAVIQTQDQALSYWAIQHCGTEADFHLRESFVLEL